MASPRLDALKAALSDAPRALILTHNDPDPDAIASAYALRFLLRETLGMESDIVYDGLVGRAENKALVRYLDRPLHQLKRLYWLKEAAVCLVDTQPGAGNNALPPGRAVAAAFDHHPRRAESEEVTFADVRPGWGATATILTEYLQAAGLELTPHLATALFYGIKTDTMGLIRGATRADSAAFCYLQSRVDMEALARIEYAQVPLDYYRSFDEAIRSARLYGNAVFAYLGEMTYPDMAAEIADLFLRLEGVIWIICMGASQGNLMISVRTRNLTGGAGQLIQNIVGEMGTAGGHGTMAAGAIPLDGRRAPDLAQVMQARALSQLQVPADLPPKSLL